jgi:ubiquinone/menaquinone biosynthesis C-methylase UbiE
LKNDDQWERLAEWYDRKQGDTGDLWHRALIDPVLIMLVGDVRGLDILDLGCGNGYLSRKFAKEGARVSAIDSSPQMIARARRHTKSKEPAIDFRVSKASRLNFASESFDCVFANMSLMDIEQADEAVSEVARVLRKGGKFVASISHPCFDNGKNSSWLVQKSRPDVLVYRMIRSYRKCFSEDVHWNITPTKRMWTRSYHRPLSWYARTLSSAGLLIEALEEPEPTKEFLEKDEEGSMFLEAPLHLVVAALKLSYGSPS